uniref:Uncharacterized protein n=1 Tax=Salarias fasciatus TaxID=181472 RepID=A0A672H850_SALFA
CGRKPTSDRGHQVRGQQRAHSDCRPTSPALSRTRNTTPGSRFSSGVVILVVWSLHVFPVGLLVFFYLLA